MSRVSRGAFGSQIRGCRHKTLTVDARFRHGLMDAEFPSFQTTNAKEYTHDLDTT